MKFTISGDVLSKALSIVSPAIQKNVVMPVLEMVLAEVDKSECTFTATNLNLSISHKVPCDSNKAFKMLLPYSKISSLASLVGSQPITIDDSGNQITSLVGAEKHKFGKSDDPSVFPSMESFEADSEFEASEEFMHHIQLATSCVIKDQMQAIFRNVCIDFKRGEVSVYSCDKIQVFRYREKVSGIEGQIRIDADFIKAFKPISSGTISFNDKFMRVSKDGTTISAKLSEYDYPDCDQFFTTTSHNFSIDRKALLSAMNKMMVFGSKSLYDFKLIFDPTGKSVEVVFNDQLFEDEYDTKILCTHSSPVEAIRLNAVFVKNILLLIPESEQVNINIVAHNKPLNIDPDGEHENLRLALMPLFS